MSIENELKLIPENNNINFKMIIELLQQNGYKAENSEPQTVKQVDIYYDDDKGTLRNAGCSLRIRYKNWEKLIITYKQPMNLDRGYTTRNEYEIEVPKNLINDEEGVKFEIAQELLERAYPEIKFPMKMEKVITIYNLREKANMTTPKGSVIEIAYDKLKSETAADRIIYSLKPEIECEMKEGNSEDLSSIYRIITSGGCGVQKNELSKYSRALSEIRGKQKEKNMSVIALCSIMSEVLKDDVFNRLRFKGQIMHRYNRPLRTNLDEFKDFNTLVNRISQAKKSKKYTPNSPRSLEDMFLCFFSNMEYEDLEKTVENFLNTNYFDKNNPTTNRLSHSQQVMLISGMICKIPGIKATEEETLMCMIIGLVHDIGHPAFAHPMEKIINKNDGSFSHEKNGREVFEEIIKRRKVSIINNIMNYMGVNESIATRKLDNMCKTICNGIEEHSRTNCEKRGKKKSGQIPRAADKICYSISDIADIIKMFPFLFNQIEKKWKYDKTRDEKVNKLVQDFKKLYLNRNFGRIIINAVKTIRKTKNDGKDYYNVDQDVWNMMLELISIVKELRNIGEVDNKSEITEKISEILLIYIFNKKIKEGMSLDSKAKLDFEKIWSETIKTITEADEWEIMSYWNELKQELTKKGILLENVWNSDFLSIEYIPKLKHSDRQLKVNPSYNGKNYITVEDVLIKLDLAPAEVSEQIITDEYYKGKNKGMDICRRKTEGSNNIQLIVKIPDKNNKNIGIRRKKYIVELPEGASLEELVNKMNEEYPGLGIEVTKEENFTIKTHRTAYKKNKGTNEEMILNYDKSTIIKDGKEIKDLEEIEINTSKNKDKIRKTIENMLIRKGLTQNEIEKFILLKISKAERARNICRKLKGRGE